MLRFVVLLSLIWLVNPVMSAEFNIKLRKTDIDDLKQQLLPTFDRNIQYLATILHCLEQGSSTDACLEQFPSPGRNAADQQVVDNELKVAIKKNLDKHDISEDEIIKGLRELLREAKTARTCLIAGQTANDLKDCVIKYKH